MLLSDVTKSHDTMEVAKAFVQKMNAYQHERFSNNLENTTGWLSNFRDENNLYYNVYLQCDHGNLTSLSMDLTIEDRGDNTESKKSNPKYVHMDWISFAVLYDEHGELKDINISKFKDLDLNMMRLSEMKKSNPIEEAVRGEINMLLRVIGMKLIKV